MPDTPVDLIDLLEKMLIYDPNNRPTAQQCLEHDFFEGVNIESIASASDSFKNKIISNQNNKLISSKLMRMTSKKYDLDSKDEKGTIYSKTSDSDKQASDKRININKFGGFPVVKNEIGSGFYVKNKPIKSPSTPSSSNSQHFGTKPQFGSKIKYGGIPYKKKEISEQTPENSSKSFANYEVRQSRFGMGKGDSDTDRNMNSIYDNDGGRGMPNVTPPPVPIPLSIMGSGGLGGGLGGLGGGGLTRGNALSLGRHQI